MSCFYDLEKAETFGVRNPVLRVNGAVTLKNKEKMNEAAKYNC